MHLQRKVRVATPEKKPQPSVKQGGEEKSVSSQGGGNVPKTDLSVPTLSSPEVGKKDGDDSGEDLYDDDALFEMSCPNCGEPISICQGTCLLEMYCGDCQEGPCVFTQGEMRVIKCVDQWEEVTRLEEELTGAPSPNICRKKAYRFFAHFLHGHLGKGCRVRLPRCVLAGVRSYWPERTGVYMGHRDE